MKVLVFLTLFIVTVSCSKEEVLVHEYKKLELVTNNKGDTIYHIKYDPEGRVEYYIDGQFTRKLEYDGNLVSKVKYENEPWEYNYYYTFTRLDSIVTGQESTLYSYKFEYAQKKLKSIVRNTISNGNLNRIDTWNYYGKNSNFYTVNSIEQYNYGDKRKYESTYSFAFDTGFNPFRVLNGLPSFFVRSNTDISPLNVNNVTAAEYSNENGTYREIIHEYTYDEDDYPIERRTITFDGETSRASVWKYYYKED